MLSPLSFCLKSKYWQKLIGCNNIKTNSFFPLNSLLLIYFTTYHRVDRGLTKLLAGNTKFYNIYLRSFTFWRFGFKSHHERICLLNFYTGEAFNRLNSIPKRMTLYCVRNLYLMH